jgi:hypothetical protein
MNAPRRIYSPPPQESPEPNASFHGQIERPAGTSGKRHGRQARSAAERWQSLRRLTEDLARQRKPAELVVLVILFARADAKTRRVRISHSTLATLSGLSRRQVVRVMKELTRAEAIAIVNRGSAKTGEPSTYQYRF